MPCSMYARTTPAVPSGPEGEPVAAAVLEEVDLLLDDVRAGADRAQVHAGVLEHRRVDAAVAVQVANPLGGVAARGRHQG